MGERACERDHTWCGVSEIISKHRTIIVTKLVSLVILTSVPVDPLNSNTFHWIVIDIDASFAINININCGQDTERCQYCCQCYRPVLISNNSIIWYQYWTVTKLSRATASRRRKTWRVRSLIIGESSSNHRSAVVCLFVDFGIRECGLLAYSLHGLLIHLFSPWAPKGD